MALVDRIGLFRLNALYPKGWICVPGARPGWQGLETMEERGEQSSGKGTAKEKREEREREERDKQ